MTLTQLSAFVLVARLGSVKAAAEALHVTEPAVSQALAALRDHFGDRLLIRGEGGMTLTAGGTRLLGLASQMVALADEAETAVREARGAPDRLRLMATSTLAELVATPLTEEFARLAGREVEVSFGVATSAEMRVLLEGRLADAAFGPDLSASDRGGSTLLSEPVFRTRLVVVAGGKGRPAGGATGWPWLIDPSGTDPASPTSQLLRRLRVPEARISVFPNQTAAWLAVAEGGGVAPAMPHLIPHQLRHGELSVVETSATPMATTWHLTTLVSTRRSAIAGAFRRYLSTPAAMQLMRSPGAGVPPSRFRPPIHVTLWS